MSTGSTDGLKHVVIMRIVKSEEQLNKYINRHHIQDLFSPEYYDTYRKHLVLVHFDKNEFIYKDPGEDISYLYFFVEGKAYRVIDEKALSEKGQDIFIDEYSLTTK